MRNHTTPLVCHDSTSQIVTPWRNRVSTVMCLYQSMRECVPTKVRQTKAIGGLSTTIATVLLQLAIVKMVSNVTYIHVTDKKKILSPISTKFIVKLLILDQV